LVAEATASIHPAIAGNEAPRTICIELHDRSAEALQAAKRDRIMIRVRPRRRKARKSVQPIATELLIEPLFVWLKLDEPARSFRALKAFWDAAGDRLRLHARGERLRGSILMVRVRSAAWSQQLHLMKTQVLERVRASRGGAGVQDLRFTVGAR
jgi:hypothetical protein